jgi:hypothetical protein
MTLLGYAALMTLLRATDGLLPAESTITTTKGVESRHQGIPCRRRSKQLIARRCIGLEVLKSGGVDG